MLFSVPIQRQRERPASLSIPSPQFVRRRLRAAERASAWGRGARWIGARLVATMLVVSAIGFGGGCRSVQRADLPIHQGEKSNPSSLSVTHAHALLNTEAANMAVEDQRRASQAYDHMRKEEYPHRDNPIPPVIPP